MSDVVCKENDDTSEEVKEYGNEKENDDNILDCGSEGDNDDLEPELKALCSDDNKVIEKEKDILEDDSDDAELAEFILEQQINVNENIEDGDGAGEERHPCIENNSDEISLGDDWSGEDYFEDSKESIDENNEELLESTVHLDDDEDKKNPQFIPRLGMFYEHDDRIDPEEFDKLEEEKLENQNKPLKSVPTERWGHDMFSEMEQIPKSKEELVELYGYDIRTEERAPRARRPRRYGRGPNKYERSWEDEEAYGKPMGSRARGGRGRRGLGRNAGSGKSNEKINGKLSDEEFPSLPSVKDKSGGKKSPVLENTKEDVSKENCDENDEDNDNEFKARKESPIFNDSWNDDVNQELESDPDQPKQSRRMRGKVVSPKDQVKVVDYNEDPKQQRNEKLRNVDQWNRDHFQKSTSSNERRGKVGRGRGQRSHEDQFRQNPDAGQRGRTTHAQNGRGRDFKEGFAHQDRNKYGEGRNATQYRQDNKGRYAEDRNKAMHSKTEKVKSTNEMNQQMHLQYVREMNNSGGNNLQSGSELDNSPRESEKSPNKNHGSNGFKNHKNIKENYRSNTGIGFENRGRGKVASEPFRNGHQNYSVRDPKENIKSSNLIPGNGIAPFRNEITVTVINPDYTHTEDHSPEASDSDLTKSRGGKRYSNQRRTRPCPKHGMTPFQQASTAPPFPQASTAPPFQQMSPLMPPPAMPPYPNFSQLTLMDHHIPVITDSLNTAQAFPTYTMAQGDQGIMRGGVTYFNQPGPEVLGGVTYFDPAAQNLLLQQQQMYQRQTSAITIVDPILQGNVAIQDLSNL